jgi:hypothetical protein
MDGPRAMWLSHQHDEPKANRKAVREMKAIGGLRKSARPGIADENLVDWFFVLIARAYNLVASERFWR